jgi:hypothetical protein
MRGLTTRKGRETRYMIRVKKRPYILLWCVLNKEIKYNFAAGILLPPVYFLHDHVVSRNVIDICLWARNKKLFNQKAS